MTAFNFLILLLLLSLTHEKSSHTSVTNNFNRIQFIDSMIIYLSSFFKSNFFELHYFLIQIETVIYNKEFIARDKIWIRQITTIVYSCTL